MKVVHSNRSPSPDRAEAAWRPLGEPRARLIRHPSPAPTYRQTGSFSALGWTRHPPAIPCPAKVLSSPAEAIRRSHLAMDPNTPGSGTIPQPVFEDLVIAHTRSSEGGLVAVSMLVQTGCSSHVSGKTGRPERGQTPSNIFPGYLSGNDKSRGRDYNCETVPP
jgi:hypothetical protein